MNIGPPPMNEGIKKPSVLDGDEDDDDLFASAVDIRGSSDATDPTSSGYDSKGGEVGRSNTMDDVTLPVGLYNYENNFKSANLVPDPEAAETPVDCVAEGSLEDDDEQPFHDAHLKPQLQLTGSCTAKSDSTSNGASEAEFAKQPPQMESIMEEDVHEFVEIKVTSPHKVGEGMSSYMAYNVKTKTNLNYFKNKEMVVSRRFSDFLGLHDKLTEKYLQNGRIIPPAPDKSVVGMTKVKMSKEPLEGTAQDEFIDRRRAALERFLNRTASHPSLRTDPDFREFLELETDLPKASQTAALSGKSMMKLINKVGDSITNITLKLEETDDWFEEKNNMFEQLELQLKKLHHSTELLVDHRKALASNTQSLSKSLSVLGEAEDNCGLSAAIQELSSVQEKVSSIHDDQASVEFFELSELIKDYLGLVGSVKDILNERVKAWHSWQMATSSLTKKRESKAKAELQQRADKVAVCRLEITELERQQDMAQENFDRISRLIKREVEAFESMKVVDFKTIIVRYLEALLTAQERIAAQWERYIPEIQRVAL